MYRLTVLRLLLLASLIVPATFASTPLSYTQGTDLRAALVTSDKDKPKDDDDKDHKKKRSKHHHHDDDDDEGDN